MPTAWMLYFDLLDKITNLAYFQSIDFYKLYFVWKLRPEKEICKVC